MKFGYFVLWLASSCFRPSSQDGVQCGRPGRPVNGTISPRGQAYFPGEKVTYGCLEGFVLFDEEGRTCLKNGSWSGDVPLCDFNLARGKKSLQSATLWSYSPDLAVDGNGDTCSFTPRGPETRWWQVHLGHKFNVVSIGVTISPGSFQEFTIYVIELLADNKALYKPCTIFKGVFQTHKGLFKCNDGLGHPGQFVYLRDDREQEEYFGLCEVEVFAYREKIPCGDPEVPVGGRVSREGEERATYSCNPGFKLEGDAVLTCSSKGKWQGQAPRCQEMNCPAPPPLTNGYIEFSNPRSGYVFNTKAHYSCNPGFLLVGSIVLTCGERGNWTGSNPLCQVVSCGTPPSFENARATLLQDSSQWSKIAVYTCNDGFEPLMENEDTITTCLGNGTWRFVNVTCVQSEITNLLHREGQGRSLAYDFNTSATARHSTPYVVISLAIVAGILAVVMVVIGVLLVRRRLLSGPGSLSPLVRPPEKDSTGMNGFHCQKAAGYAGSTIPGYIDGLGRPTHFQGNYLQTIGQKDYRNQLSGDRASVEGGSLDGIEPPYENVSYPISEPNYETLGKNNFKNMGMIDQQTTDLHPSTNQSDDTADKESIGYEPILNGKEPNYETVSNKDLGYESVKDNLHDYETVTDKEPGYETVKEDNDPGYEVVLDEKKSIHGYETLKPRLPPREKPEDASAAVPDILQNLSQQSEDPNGTKVPEVKENEVPPEILALYSKIDKSKKSKKQAPDIPIYSHPILKSTKSDSGLTQGLHRKVSKLPSGARDIIRKFNGFGADDIGHKSISPQHSISSECALSVGALRPLPPLPR